MGTRIRILAGLPREPTGHRGLVGPWTRNRAGLRQSERGPGL